MSSLQVIGAGFGRTGTESFKKAMEILYDAPCYHMFEVMKHRHFSYWIDVADGKTPQWDTIFKGYAASVDFPASAYWRELFAMNPNAKVVLTVRPTFDDWYRSALETIFPASRMKPGLLMLLPAYRLVMTMTSKVIWDNPKLFAGRFLDKDSARKVYEQNIADAKRIVPADKLLIFNVADGWEPLCKFLGKPVPTQPFPRVNDKRAFQRMVKTIEFLGWSLTAVVIALIAWLIRRAIMKATA